MKFKLSILIAILFSGFTFSQSKVGTVDSEYIVRLMPEQDVVVKLASAYGAKLDSSFNIKMQDYNGKIEAFKNLDKTVADSIKKRKYTEILILEQDVQKYKDNGTQLMQLKQSELMRPLYNKLSKVIQEVAAANGYTQVLTISGNEFAYIDEKFDITLLVMDKMGIKAPEPEKK